MTEINGADIEAVDVITFGSPCQDLSVAGKRAGLKHSANGDDETTRSGLFLEAVRIIKEMRRATHGEYPKFICWENVPGAFSSNKGEDFRTVLEELIKIVEPEAPSIPSPGKAGWPYADCIVGDRWSLAWRVFDAQYWPGTPQRRRRIYLVLDLTGGRAEKVLFERPGLRGHSEESGTPWEEAPGHAEDCAGADDLEGVGLDIYNLAVTGNTAASLTTATGQGAHNTGPSVMQPIVMDSIGGQSERAWESDTAPCLKATHYKFPPCVTVSAGFSTEHSAKARSVGFQDEISPTLRAGTVPATVYEWHNQDSRINGPIDIAYTLNTNAGGREGHLVCATDVGFFNTCEDVSPTMLARMYKDPHLICYEQEPEYIVRRLTPTECARLQGFPDRWGDIPLKDSLTDEEYSFWLSVRNTHAAINGRTTKEYTKDQILKWYNKLHSDSSEYKMWGNGIALPNALYVMQGIADALLPEEEAPCRIRS